MIGAAIRKLLTESAAFGIIAGDSVYPLRIPQTAPLPAVAYQVISNTPANCKVGVSGLDTIRLQLNIYSERYEQQEQLSAVVRQVLDGFSGTVLTANIGITYATETDLHDDAGEIYFKAQEYIITINK